MFGQQQKQAVQSTKKYIFADMRLAQKEPTDLSGMPSVDSKTNITKWWAPLLMKVLSMDGINGMLLLDELPNAPILTQNAAYQLVLDKAIGEISLSKGVSVHGAGNRLSDKSNVFDRPAALKSRFSNYELRPPSADDWIGNYAIKNNLDSRMIGFINNKPDYLTMEVSKLDSDSFPCPRSITEAAKLINGITDPYMMNLLVAGKCGPGFATEFEAYVLLGSQINIDDILDDPSKCPMDQGQRWFMLSGIKDRMIKDKNGAKKLTKNYIKLLNQIDPDMAISSLYLIENDKAGKGMVSELTKHPEASQLVSNIRKLMTEE
jgi:hypothetical protein